MSPETAGPVDADDGGGDPACWGGLVADHRDEHGPSSGAGRPDLANRTQVHHLVVDFYREITLDPLLEPVFGDVAEIDWAEHIPKLIDYWCWILFQERGYAGAVTKVHRHLHGMAPIEAAHCDRWFSLWQMSVELGWAGPHATHAVDHAESLMAGLAKHVFGFTWTAPEVLR